MLKNCTQYNYASCFQSFFMACFQLTKTFADHGTHQYIISHLSSLPGSLWPSHGKSVSSPKQMLALFSSSIFCWALVPASWSFFVSVPFGKSPHLAAVASTFLVLVFAILVLIIKSSQSGVLFIFSVLFPPSSYIFALDLGPFAAMRIVHF